jgi:hypothetical protein
VTAFEKTESGFQFRSADEVLSPPETDVFLKQLHNELGLAQLAVRKARRAELDAYQAYLTARKPLELEIDWPGERATEKVREAWVAGRIPEVFWAYKDAALARQNAVDYAWQVKAQAKLMQSINNNAKAGFETYRGGGR